MPPGPALEPVFRLTDSRRPTFPSIRKSERFFNLARFRGNYNLPDVANLLRRFHHGLAHFAGEGGAEFRHVHDYTADAVFSRGAWGGDRVDSLIFGAFILAGPLC